MTINIDHLALRRGSVAQWRQAAASLKTLAKRLFPRDFDKALELVKARSGARTSLEMTAAACCEASDFLKQLAGSGVRPGVLPRRAVAQEGPFESSEDAVSWAMSQEPCPFNHWVHAHNSLEKLHRESGLVGGYLGWAWVEKVGLKQKAMIRQAMTDALGEELRARKAA